MKILLRTVLLGFLTTQLAWGGGVFIIENRSSGVWHLVPVVQSAPVRWRVGPDADNLSPFRTQVLRMGMPVLTVRPGQILLLDVLTEEVGFQVVDQTLTNPEGVSLSLSGGQDAGSPAVLKMLGPAGARWPGHQVTGQSYVMTLAAYPAPSGASVAASPDLPGNAPPPPAERPSDQGTQARPLDESSSGEVRTEVTGNEWMSFLLAPGTQGSNLPSPEVPPWTPERLRPPPSPGLGRRSSLGSILPLTPPLGSGRLFTPPLWSGTLTPPLGAGTLLTPPLGTGTLLTPPLGTGTLLTPPLGAGTLLTPPLASGQRLTPFPRSGGEPATPVEPGVWRTPVPGSWGVTGSPQALRPRSEWSPGTGSNVPPVLDSGQVATSASSGAVSPGDRPAWKLQESGPGSSAPAWEQPLPGPWGGLVIVNGGNQRQGLDLARAHPALRVLGQDWLHQTILEQDLPAGRQATYRIEPGSRLMLVAAEPQDGFGLIFDLGPDLEGDLIDPLSMHWRRLNVKPVPAYTLHAFGADGNLQKKTWRSTPHLQWDGGWTIEVH